MDPAPRAIDRTSATVLLGAFAGAGSALLDVASTVGWLSDRVDRVRLVLALPALGASAGVLLAALFAVALGRGPWSARSLRAQSLRVGAILALPAAVVAHLLFTGGKMSRLPAQWALQPIAWLALVALGTTGVLASTRALHSLRLAPGPARWAAALSGLVLAGTFHALDHRVLPRLYEYLHAGLGALTALSLAAAGYLLAPGTLRTPPRVTRALLALSFVTLPTSLALLDRWDNVRAEVFDVHAPFVHHVAAGAEALRALVHPFATPRRERRVLAERTGHGPALATLPGAHVLLVTVDALRDDRVSAERTPVLFSLAQHGIRFARTYAQAPHSSYSISSLHTGEYLHETVALGQPQPLTTLADALRARGYHTAALYTQGIFFTEGERLAPYRDAHFGFQRADHTDRRARAQADAAMREIDDLVRRGEPPGFVWVHFFDAHEPYAGTGATAVERYDGAVHEVDAQIGRLLGYARARLHGDVLVAVSADHGEEFGEHGGVYHGSSLYEEQVRVPWILSAPGMVPARVDTPVELVDLAPTLLGILGVTPPATMRGRDARVLIAPGAPADWSAFAAVNTRTMVVRWPFKLVTDRRYGVRELYDLSRDPGEAHNLAGSESTRVHALDDQIADWLADLGQSAAGNAALARARSGDPGAAPELVALARDDAQPAHARREAVEALGTLGGTAPVDALQGLLEARDPEVRDAVAAVLGRAGRFIARDALRDGVMRDEPDTRATAAVALAALHDTRALPALVELLETGDEPAQLRAVDALGDLGSPWAAAPLLAALDDDHLRYRVVLSLARIHHPGVLTTLRETLAHDRADDVRANAAAALALAGDRTDWPWLARLSRDDGTQVYAASALGALGVIGHELAGWDARAPGSDDWQGCEWVGGGPVWELLGARGCTVSEHAVLRIRGGSTSGGCTMVVRAAGNGPLVFESAGREFARLPIGGEFREWRVPVQGAGVCGGGETEITARAPGVFRVAHVVMIGS